MSYPSHVIFQSLENILTPILIQTVANFNYSGIRNNISLRIKAVLEFTNTQFGFTLTLLPNFYR